MAKPERSSADLENALGYAFHDRRNLDLALTHSSLAYEQVTNRGDSAPNSLPASPEDEPQDNEQLEFLGDAVLGLVAAESLFRTFPYLHEGDLTRLRAQLVSRKHLGQVAAGLSLGTFLRLGRGEERSGGRQKSVLLANAMEAVIAALYLDGGLPAAHAFVQRVVVGPYIDGLRAELEAGDALGDHKSALQEWLQAHKAGSPHYTVKSETGPDHRKRFHVELQITTASGDTAIAQGSGSTKKKAEQEAARRAYQALRPEHEANETGPVTAECPAARPSGTASGSKAF